MILLFCNKVSHWLAFTKEMGLAGQLAQSCTLLNTPGHSSMHHHAQGFFFFFKWVLEDRAIPTEPSSQSQFIF